MKNATVYISILILIISCTNRKNEIKNDLEKENLKSKVQFIAEKSYNAGKKFGDPVILDSNYLDRKETIYNQDGFKIEVIGYSRNGKVRWKTITSYEPLGLMKFEKQLDSTGNIKSETTYTNKNGLLSYETHLDGIGKVTSSTDYFYNDNRLLIEMNHYDSSGKLYSKHKYKYDDERNKIEWTYYNKDGSLNATWTYKYQNGKCVEEHLSAAPASIIFISTTKYEHDEKGRLIAYKSFSPHGDLIDHIRYTDNSIGDPSKAEELDSNGTVKDSNIFEYIYDSKSNWIKKVIFSNGNPMENPVLS